MNSGDHSDRTTNQQESSDTDSKPINQPVVPPSSSANLKASEYQSNPKRPKRITKQAFRKWSLWINGILAVAAIVAAIFYFCQLQIARLDQRAWVTVTIATLEKPVATSEKPLVKVNILNSDKTPALNVKVLGVVYLAADEPGSVSFGDTAKYPAAVIGPTATMNVTLDRPPLGEDEVQAVQTNRNGIYAHGEITYLDIFGAKHHTGFCFSIREKDFNEIPMVMTACERLNWAN